MELNQRARVILELAKKYSNTNGIETMGSEYLILAMYETEDSLCHFLLNEYEVTHEEIKEKTNNIFILRHHKGEYNSSLEKILNRADELANGDKISEEHIFMSILENRNTIACSILESLGLSIDDLIEDVKEIYDFSNNGTEELSFIRNITKKIKDNNYNRFIGREDYLKKLDIIIHRRYKNNPLLIGNAGVGKTALVEGYAKRLLDSNENLTILSLNLTSMVAGTRYRGDFEERFDKFMSEIASRKDVCIFIDEIHTIVGAATNDGNLDVANMLKPHLARGDIRLIGATTLEEYHKTIERDKALLRRFQPVFISEPSILETKEILYGIKEDYEKYHNVMISNEVLDYLLTASNNKILNRYRPDKCIDILDEAMSYASISNKKELEYCDVDYAITGKTDYNSSVSYKEMEKYQWLYSVGLLENSPLLKIKYNGDKGGLDLLTLDILEIFHIGIEAILEIDLSMYKDRSMLQTLVGAPPGYVGYEDEGILSKHLLEYPMSVVIFKNIEKSCGAVESFVYSLLDRGFFMDQRGRKIDLAHTIIIATGISEKIKLGFNNNKNSIDIFDECIKGIENNSNLNNYYTDTLRRYSYEISFDFDINDTNKNKVNDYLYRFIRNKEKGKYLIHKDELDNKERIYLKNE